MNLQLRDFLLMVTLAGVAAAPAWGQSAAPSTGPSAGGTQSAASIPDFSGIWTHPSLGFESPVSGPGPVLVDPNYKGKGMQLQFTVEDDGVFTMPWSATITYRRPSHTTWE